MRLGLSFFVAASLLGACGDDSDGGPADAGVMPTDAPAGDARVERDTGAGPVDSGIENDGGGAVDCSDTDRDGDGYDAVACGGDDCNDENRFVHPDAPDDLWVRDVVDFSDESGTDIVAVNGADGAPRVLTMARRWVGPAEYDEGPELRLLEPIGTAFRTRVITTGGTTFGPALPDLALGTSGEAHVVYFQSDALHYLVDRSGTFEPVSVPTTGTRTGGRPHIAIDASGNAHIVFHRLDSTPELYYATDASGTFVTERILAAGNIQSYGVAVLPDGSVHVVYRSGYSGMVTAGYAVRTSGTWSTETIGEVQLAPEMALGTDGEPRVLARTTSGLVLSMRSGGVWTSTTIDASDATSEVYAIAVDAMNRPHVVVHRDGVLRYWTNASGTWSSVRVTAAGEERDDSVAILVDGAGSPSIFYPAASGDLVRARRATSPDGIDDDCDGSDG